MLASVVHVFLGHAEEVDESFPHLPVVLNKENTEGVDAQSQESESQNDHG